MGWICPKCGNKNKDELDKCNLCHLGKLDDKTYQKRIDPYQNSGHTEQPSSMRLWEVYHHEKTY
jgi:ribosomal protein L40E